MKTSETKTSVQRRRLTLLVGLLLLSLLVFAISAQLAQAALVSGGGGESAPITTPAGTEVGRGGVGLVAASSGFNDSWSVTSSTSGTSTTTGTSSTTYWLIGSAVAVLIAGIGAWALLRRRRQPVESVSAAYCARHPEDALCGAV